MSIYKKPIRRLLLLCLTFIGVFSIEAQSLKEQPPIDSLLKLSKFQISKNNLDSANYYLNILEERYSRLDYDQKGLFLYQKVNWCKSSGNYLGSLEFANEYLQQSKRELFTPDNQANVLVFKGLNYYFLDEISLSIDAFFEAQKIYQKQNNEFGEILCHYNIGKSYKVIKDFDNATFHIGLAISSIKNHPDQIYRLAGWYKVMASTLTRDSKPEKAKFYLDSALSASVKFNRGAESLSGIFEEYGFIYHTEGKYDEAIYNLKKAIELAKESGETSQIIECSMKLAEIYNEINKPQETINLVKPLIADEIRKGRYQTRIIDLEKHLFNAYSSLSMYEEAVELTKDLKYLSDSVNILQTRNQVKQAEIRSKAAQQAVDFELLKKQDELNQQTIRSQNIMLIASLVVIMLVIVIAVIVYRAAVINKRLSKENKDQADRLIQLDEAKSRFFANISHDLRTPMTLIMGGIQQVLENDDIYLNTKAEKQLKVGLKNGERIIHLTNEINELIKMEDSKLAIHPQYIDLDEMLNLFVQMFSSMAEIKGVHLAYSRTIFEGSSVVYVDPHHFEKVLFNLITNGLKHTRENDSLTVSLAKLEKELVVSVLDTGEGIPEENVPYIFERYYQAPDTTFKTHEGFGIGLALVKEILDKHKAKIEVSSKLNIGTEFKIYLPQENIPVDLVTPLSKLAYSDEKRVLFKDIEEITEDSKPVVHLEEISNRKNGGKKKTVLLVEDHPEVRDYIYDIISDKYAVITAPNGGRALKILEKDSVDLIITDLMMPWFDGFELLEQLSSNEKLKKIPTLVLSARTSEEDKERVLQKGVNDFLSKPFNPKELLQRMENLINKSDWNNANPDALFINNKETLDEVESALIKKVDALILEKIDDPELGVNYLADQISVSERKFFRLIKKLTGSTPLEYIKEVKLQYANKLLKEKNMKSPSEVARLIGMNNVSHFNTQFKKRFGKKPADLIQ